MPPVVFVSLSNMLHFSVKLDMILFGKTVDLTTLVPDKKSATDSLGASLSSSAPGTEGSEASTQPTGVFLTAYLGGNSRECCVQRFDASGMAEVQLRVRDGDVDALKVSVGYTIEPKLKGTNISYGPRLLHHASGGLGVRELCAVLAGPNSTGAKGQTLTRRVGAKPSLKLLGARSTVGSEVNTVSSGDANAGILQDLFNPKNGAVLHVTNVKTDFDTIAGLKLSQSCLRDLERTNWALVHMKDSIKAVLDSGKISAQNSGNMFYDSLITAGPMVPMCYGALPFQIKEWSSPLSERSWVVYSALQAKINSGLSWKELHALDQAGFGEHFMDAYLTRPTCCELTMPYCSDLTMNEKGVVNVESEDISKSLCASTMIAQGATQGYMPPKGVTLDSMQSTPLPSLIKMVATAQKIQLQGGSRMGSALEANDCENLAACILANAKGCKEFCAHCRNEKGVRLQVKQTVEANQHLFARVTPDDVLQVAICLQRAGEMLSERVQTPATNPRKSGLGADAGAVGDTAKGRYSGPVMDVNLAVVTAKGPSYDPANPQASALCGHGAVILRHVLPNGECIHRALEGTNWMAYSPSSACKVDSKGGLLKFPVVMKDGSTMPMDVTMLGTCLGQEMYRRLGVSALHRIEGKLPPLPMSGNDSPFYHSVFFSGLSYNGESLGSISFNISQDSQQPVFGAPVLGLSMSTSLALPITSNLVSDDVDAAKRTVQNLKDQANEAWPPAASSREMQNMMSYYAPVDQVEDMKSLSGTSASQCVCGQFTVAFDNPAHRDAVTQLYKHVASACNKIQETDPASDKGRVFVNGQFSSVTLRALIPVTTFYGENLSLGQALPPVKLSILRNFQKVVDEMGLSGLVQQETKVAHVNARVAEGSSHHIYMRKNGGGVGHSHRYEFA